MHIYGMHLEYNQRGVSSRETSLQILQDDNGGREIPSFRCAANKLMIKCERGRMYVTVCAITPKSTLIYAITITGKKFPTDT